MSADLWGWVLRAAWSCSADVTAVHWVHSEIFCVGEVFSPCFNSAEKSFFLLTRFLMCIFGDCLLNRFKQAKLQRSIIIRTRKVILDMILMLLPQMWCIKLRTKMHLMHFLTFSPHICISTLPHIWLKLRTCDLFRVWKRFLSILWTMSWDTAALSHKPLSFNTVALESYLYRNTHAQSGWGDSFQLFTIFIKRGSCWVFRGPPERSVIVYFHFTCSKLTVALRL